ncbi:DUF3558 domain-containing protein [Actinosynnema sp. NPDC047251]|nr:DUF3558 domain-containing protein [Saccharothrix espanaensis]
MALAAVLVLGACAPEGSQARPESTTALATTSSVPAPATTRLREVKLDGKNPCEMLTQEQLTDFLIKRPGQQVKIATIEATGCQWPVTGGANSIVPVTTDGIEVWTEGKRVGKPTAIDPIAGFKAITVTTTLNPHRCDVVVDTAAGQYLAAGFSLTTDKPENFPQPCDRARQLAEAAMQNLLK